MSDQTEPLDIHVIETPEQVRMLELPIVGIRIPEKLFPWLLATIGACLLLGWSFLTKLPAIWFDDEGYYSHGVLIPFMTLAAIYMRRDQLKQQPLSQSSIGFFVMVIGLVLLVLSDRIGTMSVSAGAFIIAVIGAAFFALGPKMGKLLFAPLAYLVFMMPVLGYFIDKFTNPLQMVATRVAVVMLKVIGYRPEIPANDPNRIELNYTTWNVGGPCSGFKLLLSLLAFSIFFVMISKLNWVKSLVLVVIISPTLGLFINGLRIMMIGVVGERWGQKAGAAFHDYSGYIALLICFVFLHFIVRFMERGQDVAEQS